MGHQIRFYALQGDLLELEQKLALRTPFVVVQSDSPRNQIRTVDPKKIAACKTLVSGFFLARTEDLASIQMHYIATLGIWKVDTSCSPVIDVWTPQLRRRELTKGRLYYERDYLRDTTVVEHSLAFRTWAAQLFRTAKQSLHRFGDDYVGTLAKEGLDRGKLKVASQHALPRTGLQKVTRRGVAVIPGRKRG